MKRFQGILIAAVLTGSSAYAGQIQIGEFAGNSINGANSGLTQNYVNETGGVQCAGFVAQGNTCVATGTAGVSGSLGGALKRGYDATLFSSVTQGATAPSPYAGYSKATAAAAGSTLTDGTDGVTFAMISDGVTGPNSNNILTENAPTTITIPVGVFGVSDVWTMLNNLYGELGANDTSLIFNFGNASNATTNLTQVTVNLTNSSSAQNAGGQSSASGDGVVRSAVDCTTVGSSTCNTVPVGSLLNSGTLATSVVVNGGSAVAGTVAVLTQQIYTSAYNTTTNARYNGSSGNAVLDDQNFSFGGTYQNMYLVSMSVVEKVGLAGAANKSDTALSAITVDTAVATPEPSTWFLLMAGFAGLVVAKRQKLFS